MSIQSDSELKVTRAKVGRLRQRRQEIRDAPDGTAIEKLTLQSLSRMINQLQEEIAMFETRTAARG